jgi:hypothetical protein
MGGGAHNSSSGSHTQHSDDGGGRHHSGGFFDIGSLIDIGTAAAGAAQAADSANSSHHTSSKKTTAAHVVKKKPEEPKVATKPDETTIATKPEDAVVEKKPDVYYNPYACGGLKYDLTPWWGKYDDFYPPVTKTVSHNTDDPYDEGRVFREMAMVQKMEALWYPPYKLIFLHDDDLLPTLVKTDRAWWDLYDRWEDYWNDNAYTEDEYDYMTSYTTFYEWLASGALAFALFGGCWFWWPPAYENSICSSLGPYNNPYDSPWDALVYRLGCYGAVGYILNALTGRNDYFQPRSDYIPPPITLTTPTDPPIIIIPPIALQPPPPGGYPPLVTDPPKDPEPHNPNDDPYDQSVNDDDGSSGPDQSRGDGGDDGPPTIVTLPPDILKPRTQEKDCSELVRACDEARAAADQADQAAATARANANAAEQACSDAKAARAQAEADLQNARNQPDTSKSWGESGGNRVTSQDLSNEKAAAQEAWQKYKSGQIDGDQLQQEWRKQGDPEHIKQLRQQHADNSAAVKAAQAKLDAAIQNENDVCGQVPSAQYAASQSDAAARAARARAETCCQAAAACLGGGSK